MGGTAIYVVKLARGLRRLGYRVAVICGAEGIPGDGIEPMREELRRAGVEVHAIKDAARTLPGRLRRLRRFVSVLRLYQGCVFVTLLGYYTATGTSTVAAVLGRPSAFIRVDLQPPVVDEVPVTWRHRFDAWWQNFVVDRYVVGCAENVADFARWLGRPPTKTVVIHTGIELERFVPDRNREPTRRALGYSPETMVIGTVSRIAEERKGMAHFAAMAGLLAPRFPQARFLIVGDGPTRAALERQIAALGIADRVCITGWRTDIPDLLAAMDIFVMPALVEGGPTTVLEAMAMAKPTVSTRVGMVPEVMAHGRSGLIVEPGNAPALADAVATLLTDEPLRRRLGQQARAVAEARFAVETMVERYLDLFSHTRGTTRWRPSGRPLHRPVPPAGPSHLTSTE
jgi:glycosyltransferase involved in cell wall biosynthesis